VFKNRALTRLASGTLVVAVAAGAALLAGGVANAAPPAGTLGHLTLNQTTGTDFSPLQNQTSGGCTAGGDSFTQYITGPVGISGPQTFPAATPYPLTTNTTAGFSASSPFTAVFGKTLNDAASAAQAQFGGTGTLQAGEYDITVHCIDGFSQQDFGTFTDALYFTDATHFTTTDPAMQTSTALTTSPASGVNPGTAVTLNAVVSPGPNHATVTGTVQFKDGTSNIGTPVTVGTAGAASTTTSALTGGSHQLTAVFIPPTGSTILAESTSPAVTFVINSPPTTTTLTVTPTSPVNQGAAVTLTGNVTPTTAAGTIQFKDGNNTIGTAVPVTNGTATTSTTTLSAGPHQLTANFVPTDPTAFAPSSSQPTTFSVTGTAPSATETINTTIAAGSLVISVANTNVTLPAPVLNSAGTLFQTSGKINPVTVVDTRASNPGWTVSGQVSDFSDGATPTANKINGGNLGWVPNVVDQATNQTVTAGGTIAPDNGIAPTATPAAGVGLSTSRTLATATASHGIGTAHLDALLNLNAPTSTPAGTYNATLTLTAI
jgi:hypothetical protein